jgi:hypothetical protein
MNIKLMKKAKLLLTLLLPLIGHKGLGQNNTIDTVLWDNENYSVIQELDPVWIDLKKGSTIKDARLHTIDTTSGKVEYLLDGTYHDVLISNIEKIQPGKFYDHVMVFKGDRTPLIEIYEVDEFLYTVIAKFKSHVKVKPVIKNEDKPEVKAVVVKAEVDYSQANSAIIFSNGNKIHIKLLSINSQNISYKRLDLLEGPTYIMNLAIPGSSKQARVNTVNGYTIIDYRF